jgi:hypothetical protein
VTREALSTDSVLLPHDLPETQTVGAWSTVIKAEMRPDVPGRALNVGLAVSGVLGALMLVAMALMSRARENAAAFEHAGLGFFIRRAQSWPRSVLEGLNWHSWLRRAEGGEGARAPAGILNAIAMATARLAQAEMKVAALAKDLGLRDVLQGEVAGVRGRLETVERGMNSRAQDKSAAMIRAILRDLERIGKIIDVASRDTGREGPANRDAALPQTLQEAYDILGLNGDASPNVSKKLVDALRMTWHPDFARDGQDREHREARMKQINAAWDIIKGQAAKAA